MIAGFIWCDTAARTYALASTPYWRLYLGGNGMQRCHLMCVPLKGSLNHTLVFGRARHSRTCFYLTGDLLWHSAGTHPLLGIATICSFTEPAPWNRVGSLFHNSSVNDFWAYVVRDSNKCVSWTLDKNQLPHAAAPLVISWSYSFMEKRVLRYFL